MNEKYYKLSDLLSAFKSESSDWLGAWTEQEIKKKLEIIESYSPHRIGITHWVPDTYTNLAGNIVQDVDEWYGYVYICYNCGERMIGKSKYCPCCGYKAE